MQVGWQMLNEPIHHAQNLIRLIQTLEVIHYKQGFLV